MTPLTTTRFRTIVIALLILSVLADLRAQGLHALPRSWPVLGLAALWVAGLFLLRVRPVRGSVAVALPLFGLSVVAAYFYPSLSMTLMVSMGILGSMLPWRWLRYLGLPVVLVGAFALESAKAGPFVWQALLSLAGLNVVVMLGVFLLLGRLASDNSHARAQQQKAHEELVAAHEELRRSAAANEELAVLRERSRLSRELHDTLGHALSTITVQLEAVRRLRGVDPKRADALLKETQDAARAAMRDLRAHLQDLRGERVQEDLGESLRALTDGVAARNGWQTALRLEAPSLQDSLRWALLQVAREALTNVERHAGATRVAVELRSVGDGVRLAIADDGRGMTGDANAPGHFGIRGMRERLKEVGGSLEIAGVEGGGTRVEAHVPLQGAGDA